MKISLKKITDISTGYQVRSKLKNTDTGSHRIIQMRNVCIDSGVLVAEENEYDSITPKNPEKYELKVNDIILMTRGRSYKASIIKQDKVGWIASGHFMILRIKDERQVLPEYLHVFLNLQSTLRYFEHEARGSNIKILNRKTVEELCVPILPGVWQERIIAFNKTSNRELELLYNLTIKKQKLTGAVLNKMIQDTI